MSAINNKLLKSDLEIIKRSRLNRVDIQKQIKLIKNGNLTSFTILKVAALQSGIISLNKKKLNDYKKIYFASNVNCVKFVPASGAATRMFQELSNVLDLSYNHQIKQYLHIFMKHIKNFAFYNDLKVVLKQAGFVLEKLITDKQYKLILAYLLTEKGLNYANLPKGLIKFHQYPTYSLTAFEEHLMEGLKLLKHSENKTHNKLFKEKAKIHFTINFNSKNKFQKVLKNSVLKLSNQIEISFSTQKKSTNIIALDKNNKLVRDKTGKLLLRQAGHGALIQNLNRLASSNSLIFIKNIDNILKESKQDITIAYQQAFAGMMIKVQEEIFKYLHLLNSKKKITIAKLDSIFKFCSETLNIRSETDFLKFNLSQKKEFLRLHLNRPLRICGLVKNRGQTGGLPFWVKDIKGHINLQIIEGAQLNHKSKKIVQMIKESTHFNPVFIVCGVKDFKGRKFNLLNFINSDTRIITEKSYQGRKIKIMELPGLWNGGMYYWNTIFVEIPKQTFAPVKSVIDLLDSRHLIK